MEKTAERYERILHDSEETIFNVCNVLLHTASPSIYLFKLSIHHIFNLSNYIYKLRTFYDR